MLIFLFSLPKTKLFLYLSGISIGAILLEKSCQKWERGGGGGGVRKKTKRRGWKYSREGGGSIELQKGRGGQTFFTLCANFDINSNFRIRPFS